MPTRPVSLAIALPSGGFVSGPLHAPASDQACSVFARGAGAGMDHAFMVAISKGLAKRDIASLRFNFPFVGQNSKRQDSPAVAHAAIRAVVAEAAQHLPGVPLFAGGKSYGGRMAAQV